MYAITEFHFFTKKLGLAQNADVVFKSIALKKLWQCCLSITKTAYLESVRPAVSDRAISSLSEKTVSYFSTDHFSSYFR